MVTGRNPSVPLTKQDLWSVGQSRLAKQFSKRLVFVLIPAVLVAIMGVAFHKSSTYDLGFYMVVIAMIGAVVCIMVVLRWYNRAVADFVKTHAGSFWSTKVGQSAAPKED